MTRSRDVANIDGILTTTGDTYYASAASTPARLAVGSTGQVLTVAGGVPTWATAGGGAKSWSLLNTGGTNLSGSTTTISGISGKDDLLILIDSAEIVTAATTISVRFNSDSANNYRQAGMSFTIPSSLNANSLITFNAFVLGDNNTNAARRSGFMEVSGANSTGLKAVTYSNMSDGTGSTGQVTGGVYTGTSTISSISIITSSSTFDGGTVFVYGAA